MSKKIKAKNRFTYYFISAMAVIAVGAFLLNNKTTSHTSIESLNVMSSSESKAAPDFNLNKLGGGKISIGDYKGKVVILDFWATWCPPCKAEIPDFIDLQRTYSHKGLQVIGIALDKAEAVEQFAKSKGINYPIAFGTDEVAIQYGGISGIPTTFIIDKDGKIITSFVGFRERSVFETEIKKLF